MLRWKVEARVDLNACYVGKWKPELTRRVVYVVGAANFVTRKNYRTRIKRIERIFTDLNFSSPRFSAELPIYFIRVLFLVVASRRYALRPMTRWGEKQMTLTTGKIFIKGSSFFHTWFIGLKKGLPAFKNATISG